MGTVYATNNQFTSAGLPPAAVQGLSSQQITDALTNASSLIDGYLATRFELPLASYGADITQKCIDLAAWALMKRRGFQPGAPDSETIRMGFEDAMKWLKDVAGGRATPSFPDSKTQDGFNPQQQEFTTAPMNGGISLRSTAVSGVPFGTLGKPKSRGW